MIIFPWLIAFAFLVLLATVVLSVLPLVRTLRGRGATPFVRPALTTSVFLALLFALLILAWSLVSGER